MKKWLTVVLAVMLLLSACSSGGGNKQDSSSGGGNGGGDNGGSASGGKEAAEITIWAWDPNFNIKALNIAKERYSKINPDVKINIVENAQADIIQKLNTGLGSGTTTGLPNIVLIEDYRAQSFLKAFPDMFYELTDTFNAADFAEYKIGPTSVDGRNYGLPFDSGVTGLFVRTDYLAEAGYSPDDLQALTWNEFIEIGKNVKEATGKDMLSLDPNDLGIIRVMIQTAGKWYLDESGEKPFLAGNEALKEAFQLYKEMMEADIVKPNADWSQFVAAFNSGDVASVPTGNWINASIKAESSQAGKWAVVPIPRLAGQPGSVNASNLGGSSWYVLNVPGKEAAADFLAKTFGSDVEFYQELVTEIGAIGTYIPASTGEAYSAPDPFYNGQKTIADFAKWTEDIPRVNFGAHTYVIEDILVVEMQNYLNGKPLDDALNDAQKQAEAQVR
ncbi:MAG: ABC transporter substrate-binding protein [Thermobacillus sp.]|uniref:ABC transporter substrate-binding protein n=1 Tax=Thermobacillus sp. TaxID=2108467 RepID=UPI000E36D617|nr:ABC transporter substrate-binding protein [Thermobacillus sp.]REK55941.1 MAG: ABC transporter substrate-binding protein [Thermobacillus sp.]